MFSVIPLGISTEYKTSFKKLIIESCNFNTHLLLKVKEFFRLNAFVYSYSVLFSFYTPENH